MSHLDTCLHPIKLQHLYNYDIMHAHLGCNGSLRYCALVQSYNIHYINVVHGACNKCHESLESNLTSRLKSSSYKIIEKGSGQSGLHKCVPEEYNQIEFYLGLAKLIQIRVLLSILSKIYAF